MGYFWSKKLCILPNTSDKGLFSKNIHDRQKKQHTFSLNKLCSHYILLLLVFFPLSNCSTRTVSLPYRHTFDMTKYQSKEGTLRTLFQNLVNQSHTYQKNDLQISHIWYIYLLLLLMSVSTEANWCHRRRYCIARFYKYSCCLSYGMCSEIFNTDTKTFKFRSMSLYNFIEYFVEVFILGMPFE